MSRLTDTLPSDIPRLSGDAGIPDGWTSATVRCNKQASTYSSDPNFIQWLDSWGLSLEELINQMEFSDGSSLRQRALPENDAVLPARMVLADVILPFIWTRCSDDSPTAQNWDVGFPAALASPSMVGLYQQAYFLQAITRQLILLRQPAAIIPWLSTFVWQHIAADTVVWLREAYVPHPSCFCIGSWNACSEADVAEIELAVTHEPSVIAWVDSESTWQSLPYYPFTGSLAQLEWQAALVVPFSGWGVLIFGVSAARPPYFAEQLEWIARLNPVWTAAMEQFHAQKRLKQLEQAVNQSAASIVITNVAGEIEFVNPAFTKLTGYTEAEALGENPRILKSDLTATQTHEQLWDQLIQQEQWRGVFCNRKKNGDYYWESAVISPIVNESGQTTHYVAVKDNITEQVELEQQIKQKSVLLDEFITQLPGVFYIYTHEGRIVYWNQHLLAKLQLSEQQMAGMHVVDLFMPEFAPLIQSRLEQQFSGNTLLPYEAKLRVQDGQALDFYLRSQAIVFDDKPAVMVVGLDLSENKALQVEIDQKEQYYTAILNRTQDAISLLDPTGVTLFNTPSADAIVGYEVGTLLGRNLFELLHPSDLERARSQFVDLLGKRGGSTRIEVRAAHRSGTYLTLDVLAINLLDDPAIQAIMISSRDITDRKAAEAALEQERNQLRLLIDNIPDSIYIKDRFARKIIANEMDRKIMRVSRIEDFEGKTDLELYPYDIGIQGYTDDLTVLASGNPVHDREERFVDEEQEERWLLTSKVPIRNAEGEVTGLLGIGRDITQRKLTNDQLRESNTRFEFLSRATFDAIWDVDIHTQGTVWGDNYETIFGYKPGDPIDNLAMWENALHPEDRARVMASFSEVMAGKAELWRESYRFRKADGNYAQVQDRGILVRNAKGEPVRIIGAMQDITLQYHAQEQVLAAERRFRVMIEHSTDGLIVLNKDLQATYVSPSATRILGYHGASDLPEVLFDLVHPDDQSYAADLYQQVISNPGKPIDGLSRIRHKNGQWRWKSYTITNLLHVPEIEGFVENFRDVTEKIDIERTVLNERDLSDSIINSLPGIFCLQTASGSILRFNRDFLRITGYSEEEILVLDPQRLYRPDDWQRLTNYLETAQESPSQSGLEITMLSKAGGQIPLFIHTHPIKYQGESCWVVVGIDISDRRAAEAENRKLGMIASLTINAVILTDDRGCITWVNSGFERLTGYKQEEVLGRKPGSFLQGPDTDMQVVKYMSKCQLQQRGYKTELLNYDRQKHPYWVEIEVVPLFDDAGKHTGFMSIERDITERRDSEARLQSLNKNLVEQARELADSNAELERFAYVASHDLQEPLRMVNGFLNLIKQRYSASFDETGIQYIDFAVNGANRMKQLIIDLLNYSRVGTDKSAIEQVNLQGVIDELLPLFNKDIEELQATIETVGLPTIPAFKSQMLQLFQNLIGNAIKYRKENEAPEIRITCQEETSDYLISVQDNGIGMEHQYLDRIFVIFQRLHGKEEYSGTGIGLAICKKIVDRHGGRIWATSELGVGSTFHLRLPKSRSLADAKVNLS